MFRDLKIGIPCGNCGRETEKTVTWLKHNAEFTCACGTLVKVDASQFNREMQKVDKAFDDLNRTLKRVSRQFGR